MGDLLIEALKAERDWHERQWDFALDDARECAHREEKGAERIAMDRANGHHHRLSAIDAVLARATTPAQPERGGDEAEGGVKPKAPDAAEVVEAAFRAGWNAHETGYSAAEDGREKALRAFLINPANFDDETLDDDAEQEGRA